MKIWIPLEVSEALLVQGAVADRALEASKLAAESDGDVHEIADVTSRILGRVATRITDALYPTCGWGDDEPCENSVEADGLCGRHLRHRARVAEILA